MRWSLVCACLLTSGLASAAPTPYELAWRRGNELSGRHRYAEARAQYQTAWQLEHRPLLLFNIASCYLRDGDLLNARVYYRWYLDVADDPGLAATARERLDRLTAELAPPARATAAYPTAVIDRPPTLPATTFAPGAGVAIAPHYTPAMGRVTTSYDPLAVLAAGYAPVAGLELDGEADLVLGDPGRSLALVRGELALAGGDLTAGVRASLTYTFDRASLYDLRIGAPARWKLTDQLAIVSDEDHVLLTLDTAHHDLFVRAPLGIAYQITPRIHGELATRLAVAELRAPSLQVLGADYEFVSLALTVVPRDDLDVVVQARAFDTGGDGSVFVRWRR